MNKVFPVLEYLSKTLDVVAWDDQQGQADPRGSVARQCS